MNKLKVLVLNKMWPLSMGSYFIRALQRRDDIDLKTTGQFSGAYIPWKSGMRVPEKYVYTPDIPLSLPMEVQEIDYNMVKMYLGDWKPDLIINTSSTCYWKNKPTDGYCVAVAIDPHVLDYDHARSVSDKFFNMQKVYSKEGDIYLPYAYDPTVHYEMNNTWRYKNYMSDSEVVEKIYDVCAVGLEYPWRVQLIENLQARGLRCHISTGPIFDEYRKIYSQSHIGLNWSSLDDLNARAFETPMMSIPVMNEVTDFKEFIAFSNTFNFPCDNNVQDKSRWVGGAVEQVMWIMDNLEAAKERTRMVRAFLSTETYDARIQQILDTTGFGG
jgi:hypothetical protein